MPATIAGERERGRVLGFPGVGHQEKEEEKREPPFIRTAGQGGRATMQRASRLQVRSNKDVTQKLGSSNSVISGR